MFKPNSFFSTWIPLKPRPGIAPWPAASFSSPLSTNHIVRDLSCASLTTSLGRKGIVSLQWGYSVTIVIRFLRIWIMFEYLNYFESLNYICDFGNVWVFELFWVTKTAYVFLELIVSYSFWYMENWLFSKPWYLCKVKVCDLCATYYIKTMRFL